MSTQILPILIIRFPSNDTPEEVNAHTDSYRKMLAGQYHVSGIRRTNTDRKEIEFEVYGVPDIVEKETFIGPMPEFKDWKPDLNFTHPTPIWSAVWDGSAIMGYRIQDMYDKGVCRFVGRPGREEIHIPIDEDKIFVMRIGDTIVKHLDGTFTFKRKDE